MFLLLPIVFQKDTKRKRVPYVFYLFSHLSDRATKTIGFLEMLDHLFGKIMF